MVSQAVEEFYAENEISYSIQPAGKLQLFKNDSIDIFQGDFFDLTQEETGLFEAIYDRGSIVALARPERQKYVEHLLSFLAPGGRLLLITLEYDQEQMSGPPFSVAEAEIEMLFSQYGRLELLETCEILDERLRNKGLDGILERVYQLVKN
jgi:thiopurine S-methyltransferase